MFLSWNRIALLHLLFLHIASANVNCGGHTAATCADCPINPDGTWMGEGWCNGECKWTADNECVHEIVAASRYGYELRHENTQCLSQSKNYGDMRSPKLCAMAAGEDGCGSFMFSSAYTSWGCRCCSSPNPNHDDHDLWTVYDVVDCDDPNSECITTATILLDGVRAARDFCADPNPESSPEKYETAARNLSDILSAYSESIVQDPEMEAAASEAAVIARDVLAPDDETGEKCSAEATGCNRGMVLLHQLRNLLALRDLDPFPDSIPHGALFEEHRVLIADGLFFNSGTMEVVHSYFDAVPDHLMIEGMRRGAPFVTMQVKDEFKCDGFAEEIEISVTARGFNVFRNQLGDTTENAFGSTSFPFIGDLLMTVTRHEAAHQFDRFVADDDDLRAMKQTYTSRATADHDWLRNSVGNEYFQQFPQEILASQIGNQYTLSSSNQLALALDRFSAGTSVLPLAWVLLHVDIFSHSPTECTDRACRTRSLFYHSGAAEGGITSTYCVEVGRDSTTGQIISLGLPGCPVLGVTWSDDGDGVGALPVAVQPETWSCMHSLEAWGAVCDAEAPTSTPTMTPSKSPSVAPITAPASTPTMTPTYSPIPVVDGGFEDDSSKWKLTDEVVRVCNSGDGHHGACAMKFVGNKKKKRQSIVQGLKNLDLKSGDTLLLSFWVKGEGMRNFKSKITLRNKRKKVGKFICSVDKKGTFDYYEVECSPIDVTKECDKLILKFESKAGNEGKKMFLDSVKLSQI